MQLKQNFLVATCFSAVLGISTPVTAQPASPTPTIDQEQTESDAQVEALEAQLELMERYDQRLLDTVFWSLGIVVAIALGISTVNFFVYKYDKDALKRDLEEAKNILRQELQGDVNALNQRLQNEMVAFKQELQELVRGQSEINQTTLQRELRQRVESIQTTIEERLESVKSDQKNKYDRLRKLIQVNEYELQKIEAELEEGNENYASAARSFLKAAKLSNELGYDWAVVRDLAKLRSNLENLLTKQRSLPPDNAREITEFINELPQGYSVEVEKIHKLLREISLK